MKDIVNSFKAHLYERTSSPLIGAFIFYWLIFNYKMIVILFDDKLKSNEKFTNIDIFYQNDFFYNIPIHGLIYPIIATLLYLLIFPWISNLIFEGWTYHQNNLKEIGNKKVLTYEEYGNLQRRFTELELSFDETFSTKDNEILKLKELIESKDSKYLEIEQSNQLLRKEIDEKNIDITNNMNQINDLLDLKVKNEELKEENSKLKKEIIKLPELTNEELDVLQKVFDLNETDINSVSEELNKDKLHLQKIMNKLIFDELIKVTKTQESKEKQKVSLTELGQKAIYKFGIPF